MTGSALDYISARPEKASGFEKTAEIWLRVLSMEKFFSGLLSAAAGVACCVTLN
ncbi:hypothetical protein QA646_15420 [Rhizobium sp. CB3090]|uniref:hypothetical protein n=1 Tax=Rhizobium sp. CB3090 TaxID=3039156 RepID=UPI0024B0A262|nr:hypothetical protein [Rhizobium sp. CB3090]WFU08669.1 hypothetical protein QA646_15420 [Rhizobium sp. CB3090]